MSILSEVLRNNGLEETDVEFAHSVRVDVATLEKGCRFFVCEYGEFPTLEDHDDFSKVIEFSKSVIQLEQQDVLAGLAVAVANEEIDFESSSYRLENSIKNVLIRNGVYIVSADYVKQVNFTKENLSTLFFAFAYRGKVYKFSHNFHVRKA